MEGEVAGESHALCLELYMPKHTGEVINDFILLKNKTILFTITLKIKYQGVNLMKDVQEPYPGNCKHF